MALPTATCNSSSALLVRRRTPLFFAPGWHDVAVVEMGETLINGPVTTLTGWKRCGVLERALEAGCCPHVVDGGAASIDGRGERHTKNLVVWRCRG
ncbi:hypothetical protein S83_002023 [Arachis hypogaea]